MGAGTVCPDRCREILLSLAISKCDFCAPGQNHFISNHPFLRGTVRRAIPLFAKRFAGQTLVYSKTLQMLFGTCADVFGMAAVKSTRGRRFENHNCGDFDLFKSNECASTCHPCREEMLSVDVLPFLMLPFAASRISEALWSQKESW